MISVNILSWNNKKTIEKLLDAVKCDMDGIEHEYIIVDNGSDDGTVDLVSNWIARNLKDNFTFIKNSSNTGISKGKNIGIEHSKGDYIFMLDGDVIPVRNSMKLMIDWIIENKKDALGVYPNKFSNTPDHAEEFCHKLLEPKEFKCCCLYYGIFDAKIFENIKMSVDGEFGKPGYGWEDHDFFKKMKKEGFKQYVAHINSEKGKYFHDINSSIRAMGHNVYSDTSRARGKQFKEKWNAAGQGSNKSPRRTRRTRRSD